ncbi:MAG: ABC transporter ATP-binding protein [Clostridia bacterium]|nr:ABC transporter ATP-binding protein [Clostridia bacterium]
MAQSLGFMLKKARAHHRVIPFLCLGISVTSAGIYLLELFISPAVLDRIETGAPLGSLLLTLGLFLGGLYVLNWLGGYFEKQAFYLYTALRCEIADDIRFKAMTTSYPNTTDPHAVNLRNLAHEATAGSSRATEQVWRSGAELLTNLICFCIYLALLSNLHWLMIVLVLATSLICFFLNNRIYAWVNSHRHEEAKSWTEQQYIRAKCESPAMAKDIHVFGLKNWLIGIFDRAIDKDRQYVRKREKHFLKARFSDLVFSLLRNSAAYAYLVWLTLENGLSAAEFLLYFSAVTGFATWITGILGKVTDLRRCCFEISNVREYIDLVEPFRFGSGEPIPPSDSYELRLENVTFSYPGSDKPVISDMNLTLRAGEKLALVGLNGAGKTTLVRLLCGFYDPDRGRVLLNGRDIRDFDRREYYRLFSAVFQDYSLLDVTVGENVSQQTHGADTERINAALDSAGLTEAVNDLPGGIHTHMGRNVFPDGVLFSGGQTQRLMLARALYKNGPILILDEPTAALDPIAENSIYMKYRDMTRDKTSLFISHRLASTRFCDRIIFLSDGTIAEEGTHDELMSKNGQYAKLFEVQSQYYREETKI